MSTAPALTTARVTGITRKGKNKIAEARQSHPSWDGETWVVLQQLPKVLFSNQAGPWLEVMPAVDIEHREKLSRWVHATESQDFQIHQHPETAAAA